MATEWTGANKGGLDGFTSDPHRWSRQAVGLHLGALMVKTTGAQVRGGVLPANGNPLGYVPTTGLSATFKAGVYVWQTAADIGPVKLVVDADVVFTHPTAHASQPRTDLVIAELVDNGDNTSTMKPKLLVGTAGSGAPDPTLPTALGNGAVVILHRVSIPANLTTLTSGHITDLRAYTAAVGAVVLPNVAAASGLPEGTLFYLQDTDTLGWKTAAGTETAQGVAARAAVVGARQWQKAQTVPVPTQYGLGDLRSAMWSPSTYGTAPATVIGTSPYEQLVISATGLYDVHYWAFSSSSHSNSFIAMAFPDDVIGLGSASGFDTMGWANIVRTGMYLTAGYQLFPKITNGESGSRDYIGAIRISRIA